MDSIALSALRGAISNSDQDFRQSGQNSAWSTRSPRAVDDRLLEAEHVDEELDERARPARRMMATPAVAVLVSCQ